MDSLITQLGIGGIFAVLVIREVLKFLGNNKIKNSNSKECFVLRSEFEKHKDSVQYKDSCEQIVKRLDGTMEERNRRFDGLDKKLEKIFGELSHIRRCNESK